jgi:catechol 2,3-dioxygenase-like lactoylglutathione lyase family enzyme
MDLTIHTTFLPHTDPEASLAFYRDLLGFELVNDVGQGAMRWLTFVAPSQPDVRLVLTPPAADPGITDDERRVVAELMAKGSYQAIILGTKDLDGTFERLAAADAGGGLRADRAAVGRPRLRVPRPRREHGPHRRGPLTRAR